RLNSRLRLKVEHLAEWVKSEKNPNGKNPYDLTLFLSERQMKGIHPFAVDTENNILHFRLIRDPTNADQKIMWDDLLGRATSFRDQHIGAWQKHGLERTVRISVGFENQTPVKSD